jgi:hypothetical protein
MDVPASWKTGESTASPGHWTGRPGFGGARFALAPVLTIALPALSAPAGPVEAATEMVVTEMVVTETADTSDGACTTDDCLLGEAVVYATVVGADEIKIPAGAYRPTR